MAPMLLSSRNRANSETRRIIYTSFYRTKPYDSRMGKGRLEAFSDGVIAIIITIMVLELKVPHGAQLSALSPLVPNL